MNYRQRANKGFLLADDGLVYVFNLAPVLVPKRQMVQKILNCLQPESSQLLGALGTDTFEITQRRLKTAGGALASMKRYPALLAVIL